MKRLNATTLVQALLVALACTSALTSNAETRADVPPALTVSAGQKLALEAHANGVQIYECKANKDDPQRFAWSFKAPEAELLDEAGKSIGKHYAGPTWESNDGSKVVGEVKAKEAGPDANSIPWLLLSAKSTAGQGVFGQTQSIQRVDTKGGNAPVGGCSEANAGEEVRVLYTATYRFYVAGQ